MDNLISSSMNPTPTQDASKAGPHGGKGNNLDMLMDVMLQVTVELGRARMTLRQVIDLQQGSVVELDRQAGDVVDVFINDRLVAHGEVVVVDDKFGVRITELLTPKDPLGEQE